MKERFLNLCSCTSLEIITAIGVTGYLFYLEEIVLAMISTIIFAKLIAFHFIMEYFDKRQKTNRIVKISKKGL
ncbi:MAG: hypothetical protein KC483_01780 [Nitrosarchaeum sp.]|nr:hypothetical protein [Nitrosarchaeum sp.]MCA9820236.1 hypothetical protein [Nitrosarchaeum sp.]